jgi:hypothetical protein
MSKEVDQLNSLFEKDWDGVELMIEFERSDGDFDFRTVIVDRRAVEEEEREQIRAAVQRGELPEDAAEGFSLSSDLFKRRILENAERLTHSCLKVPDPDREDAFYVLPPTAIRGVWVRVISAAPLSEQSE